MKKDSGRSMSFIAIISLVVSITAITIHFIPLSNSNEIVYVDAMKLVNGYKGMADARKEFEAKTGM